MIDYTTKLKALAWDAIHWSYPDDLQSIIMDLQQDLEDCKTKGKVMTKLEFENFKELIALRFYNPKCGEFDRHYNNAAKVFLPNVAKHKSFTQE